MECRDCENLISGYLDGELEPKKKAEFERHVSSCKKCAETLGEYKNIDKLLKSSDSPHPGESYWAGFEARLNERIKITTGEKSPKPQFSIWRPLGWAFIAVMILVGVINPAVWREMTGLPDGQNTATPQFSPFNPLKYSTQTPEKTKARKVRKPGEPSFLAPKLRENNGVMETPQKIEESKPATKKRTGPVKHYLIKNIEKDKTLAESTPMPVSEDKTAQAKKEEAAKSVKSEGAKPSSPSACEPQAVKSGEDRQRDFKIKSASKAVPAPAPKSAAPALEENGGAYTPPLMRSAAKSGAESGSSLTSEEKVYLLKSQNILTIILASSESESGVQALKRSINDSGYLRELETIRGESSHNNAVAKHAEGMSRILDTLFSCNAPDISSIKCSIRKSGILQKTKELNK